MKLLQIFLATAMVLDAALMMTTTAVATSSPVQAVSLNTDAGNNGIFSQAVTTKQ